MNKLEEQPNDGEVDGSNDGEFVEASTRGVDSISLPAIDSARSFSFIDDVPEWMRTV